jgi:phosphoribosylformylglycinamidine synthase
MKLQARWEKKVFPEPDFKEPEDLTYELLEILSRLNVCSKEYVIRQYDHEVQGGSVVKPLVGKDCDGPSDAACIRPLLHSYEGVVISCGICPKYGDIDTYHMTACAIDEAIRNNIAVGGNLKHMALLDNFCWPDPIKQQNNPDGDFKLAQLVRANQALYDYTTVFETPCISGKDSMKNDYQIGSIKISVPPTILFSCISKIEDIRKAITMDAKKPGDLVYVVGDTYPEMGGSEYYIKHGYTGNNVPKVNVKKAKKIYEQISFAIDQGLIASCHDCSDGGLGVALAEVAFAGGLGMSAHLAPLAESANIKRNDFLLFSESQSRFIVTISKEDKSSFEEIMDEMPCYLIGEVRMDSKFLLYGLDDRKIVDTDIKDLKEAWQKTLRW